ncbi:hypothetical protein BIY24_01695 [Halobacteriovorax marinus]|uniref:glycosyltransferase family 2 protein n=1 Tax=Halobacteriovorax marinus TaxID=97084 RepID=UPI000BC30866|nr:glycosyltransferase [Halobacteriovorax marinus]ATH06695.1 hypothetical protein BIY24_01695 [Halobacteriovorax marinus]
MSDEIVFSIIMPAYNAEKYIKESIQSVVSQDFISWELLVIDDGSFDKTKDVVTSFDFDNRIKYFYQENSGVARARNLGIEKSRGEYVAFLDSDDLWVSSKLSRVYLELVDKPTVGLLYSNYYCFTDDRNEKVEAVHYPYFNDSMYESLIVLDYIATLTAVVRRTVLIELKGFDESFFGTEDWDLWIRVAEVSEVFFLDERLGFYRIHSGGISKNIERQIRQELAVIEKHRVKCSDNVYSAAKILLKVKQLRGLVSARDIRKNFVLALAGLIALVIQNARGALYLVKVLYISCFLKKY